MSALDRLADCGRRPNCVSSTATDPRRRVGPWPLIVDPEAAWKAIRAAVESLPRTKIIDSDGDYLRAEARSRIFRFVDDLEVVLAPDPDRVAVRSASRLGYSDRGVNRRRAEALRRRLVADGLIAP